MPSLNQTIPQPIRWLDATDNIEGIPGESLETVTSIPSIIPQLNIAIMECNTEIQYGDNHMKPIQTITISVVIKNYLGRFLLIFFKNNIHNNNNDNKN